MLQRCAAWFCFVLLLTSPATGFDTFWHFQACRQVGAEFGFTEDAWKIMQLGDFSPDFFGPVSDFANERLSGKEFQKVTEFSQKNLQARRAAAFLHFDNLNGELTRNAQFDYLFTQLLHNTQAVLAGFNRRTDVDERTRKVLTLVTLGASLHAVQDFYSHSDWIHNDFNKTAVKMVPLPSGGQRAPTWFEFRDKSGAPDTWPIRVTTGIYPPNSAQAANTHTHMNHDNSRLLYKEYETAGAPVKSQAPYHHAGLIPAQDNDAAATAAHQRLAADTAVAASIEWVRRVEEDSDAKAAIETARKWNLKISDPKLAKELQAGLAVQLALSCAAGRWDGEDPPAERGVLCKSTLEKKLSPVSATSGEQIESAVIGLIAGVAVPWAMKFTGKFWDVYGRYQLLEQLTQAIGSESGHYQSR